MNIYLTSYGLDTRYSDYMNSYNDIINVLKNKRVVIIPNATLLDGSLGVANEVKHQLTINKLLNTKSTLGNIEIINSKDESLVDRSFEILNN